MSPNKRCYVKVRVGRVGHNIGHYTATPDFLVELKLLEILSVGLHGTETEITERTATGTQMKTWISSQ